MHDGTEGAVDGIDNIAAHHRYLIDDDRVGSTNQVTLALVDVHRGTWSNYLQGQSQEGVDGLTSDKDGSSPRRCKYDEVLVDLLLDTTKECRLSCPGLAGEEEAAVGVKYQSIGLCQLLVDVLNGCLMEGTALHRHVVIVWGESSSY